MYTIEAQTQVKFLLMLLNQMSWPLYEKHSTQEKQNSTTKVSIFIRALYKDKFKLIRWPQRLNVNTNHTIIFKKLHNLCTGSLNRVRFSQLQRLYVKVYFN